ncbi:hypothetical protein [Jejuia pallidilutea]|uniref:Transporter n=1 Tax=Jejuia pallidilutea TaxID=504487 RepID=A0A090VS53_9FLAO|nr:hypothetical protein [Jejuia pallidilutea]GAL66843.1 hypothetical protein JCM19301_1387 [Jejuia pallidilutea]GAL70368.1 hypothetical protein JCM19302_3490 [Jejuia pallidilutea]GAL90448.1 hypothetical protein JCM19538_213 [Jejuia pallidilutea]
MKRIIVILVVMVMSFNGFSQEEEQEQRSVIQTYTPSILLKKGQWDIKWFNNLYTETKDLFGPNGEKQNIPRNTFFTSTVDVFTGVSNSNTLNVGLLLEFRSNVIGGRNALDVFSFDGERGTARSGFTSFAPAIKFNPIKNVGNFTIQTAFHIPLVDNETEEGVFLDQDGFIFQNRFFYDYSFASGDWQLFSELNTEYNFGEQASFAYNSLRLTPGVFLSYFPSSKFTVLGLVQHIQLISFSGNDKGENNFSQNASIIGGGAKYQLTKALNVEFLYSNFFRGNNTGLGQTFNIGLRALF